MCNKSPDLRKFAHARGCVHSHAFRCARLRIRAFVARSPEADHTKDETLHSTPRAACRFPLVFPFHHLGDAQRARPAPSVRRFWRAGCPPQAGAVGDGAKAGCRRAGAVKFALSMGYPQKWRSNYR